jgi:hypothetical protein
MYAEHSRDRLRVTHPILTKILTYYQVMPEVLDFFFTYGAQLEPRNIRFSSFVSQCSFHAPSPDAPRIPGRSGRQFQLCYNLKGVTLKSEAKEAKLTNWSIRSTSIHHQFDIVHGTATWIITKGGLDLHERYKQLTSSEGRPEDRMFGNMPECLRSSFAAHLMFCQWATEGWQWHILWIEDAVNAEVSSRRSVNLQLPVLTNY